MESLKPIEPGCLAVIVNSKHGNNGLMLRVVEYVGEELPDEVHPPYRVTFKRGPYWRTDRPVPKYSVGRRDGKVVPIGEDCCVSERNLMRIDGHEPDEFDEMVKDDERTTTNNPNP
jgi:hypothetical protein